MGMFHRWRRTAQGEAGTGLPYKPAASFRTAPCALTLVAGTLLLGGCSTGPDLDTLATGSVTPRAYAREPVPKGIAPDDWAAARTALAEALHEKEAAPSVPWENVASATRGTVTPLAGQPSGERGKCREFLMSFVRETGEDWLQGEACKAGKSGWKVDQARLLERG
ncbi:hypothetical protein GCM10017643_39550 [Ancylobacter dichloromethanicus]|uniref:Surface antigen domain-containing protein n=2 Tax=Ancylobacter dichloromethanicus TaxID=518825 RepID=A0A9W6JBB1_9HYPH|nr:hypothetical protein GCM10017643_39550 [Ancylobacter dichloromethanicus]